MSKSMQEPLYQTLGPSEIRLLSLHPGLPGNPIRCSLSHAELQIKQTNGLDLVLHGLETDSTSHKIKTWLKPPKQPEFEALSYCWGPDATYHSIVVNGRQVPIRRNMWWALAYLRYRTPGMKRTLWIDALCINQDDLAERSAQVSIMGSIYSIASRVLISLGKGSADSKAAFEAMAKFLRRMGTPERFSVRKRKLWSEKWFEFFQEKQDLFTSLCENPYWGRLWIIQEVCLASRMKVHCGSDTIEWDQFLRFWELGLKWYSDHPKPPGHLPFILPYHLTSLLAI